MPTQLQPKPWPSDAVMIVAANDGEENRANMRGVVLHCGCRDCGQALAVDSYCIDQATHMPERLGRPVSFFCIPCATRYDANSITHFVDHR